jgi:hypothetical protein
MTNTNQPGTPDPRDPRNNRDPRNDGNPWNDGLAGSDSASDPATRAGGPDSAPGLAEDKPKPKMDLSLTQTLGGALAAMTAAALGSRLGVAGTIVGAAVASIIAAVAGSLYTASLRHTREKVKTVWSGHVAGSGTPTSVDVVSSVPDWDLPDAASAPQQPVAPRPDRAGLPWKGVLTGAIAAFAIAIVALTGFELLSGTAISGGQGTTVEQATKPNKPTKSAPSDDSSTEKESPSTSASASESDSPTASATDEATPSASEEPTADTTTEQPTEQATPDEPATTAPESPSVTAESTTPSATQTTEEAPSEAPEG